METWAASGIRGGELLEIHPGEIGASFPTPGPGDSSHDGRLVRAGLFYKSIPRSRMTDRPAIRRTPAVALPSATFEEPSYFADRHIRNEKQKVRKDRSDSYDAMTPRHRKGLGQPLGYASFMTAYDTQLEEA